MAHASGPAIENVVPADFFHPGSAVHYRIYSEAGRVWLSFERPGDPAVRGKRELLYYIGSGRRGLSYLFAQDGFLFESPVNWYSHEQRWDMAPAYQNAHEIPLNLPAYTSCLRCHVSGMRAPVKGTDDLYPKPAFLDAGVSCERCHGPGAAHITGAEMTGAAGTIVNPSRLSPERRDAVCMQCHLEGKVAIERRGRHTYEFQPGDVSDYTRYYVMPGSRGGRLGGVSQVEALTLSMCKKKSGDAMSCTRCHDPHYRPPAEERVTYYREKCLACHGTHLRRNTMSISPTARFAICRRLRAPMSPTHRSRTTGFPAVLPSSRGSRTKSALRPPFRAWFRFRTHSRRSRIFVTWPWLGSPWQTTAWKGRVAC
jgi:hypothetical protein